MTYCGRCYTEVDAAYRFCLSCGATLNANNIIDSIPELDINAKPNQNQEQAPNPGKRQSVNTARFQTPPPPTKLAPYVNRPNPPAPEPDETAATAANPPLTEPSQASEPQAMAIEADFVMPASGDDLPETTIDIDADIEDSDTIEDIIEMPASASDSDSDSPEAAADVDADIEDSDTIEDITEIPASTSDSDSDSPQAAADVDADIEDSDKIEDITETPANNADLPNEDSPEILAVFADLANNTNEAGINNLVENLMREQEVAAAEQTSEQADNTMIKTDISASASDHDGELAAEESSPNLDNEVANTEPDDDTNLKEPASTDNNEAETADICPHEPAWHEIISPKLGQNKFIAANDEVKAWQPPPLSALAKVAAIEEITALACNQAAIAQEKAELAQEIAQQEKINMAENLQQAATVAPPAATVKTNQVIEIKHIEIQNNLISLDPPFKLHIGLDLSGLVASQAPTIAAEPAMLMPTDSIIKPEPPAEAAAEQAILEQTEALPSDMPPPEVVPPQALPLDKLPSEVLPQALAQLQAEQQASDDIGLNQEQSAEILVAANTVPIAETISIAAAATAIETAATAGVADTTEAAAETTVEANAATETTAAMEAEAAATTEAAAAAEAAVEANAATEAAAAIEAASTTEAAAATEAAATTEAAAATEAAATTEPTPPPLISADTLANASAVPPPDIFSDKELLYDSRYAPLTVANLIGIFMLMLIPAVNIILLIIWALGGCHKYNKRNLARTILLILIIIAIPIGLFYDQIMIALAPYIDFEAIQLFFTNLI